MVANDQEAYVLLGTYMFDVTDVTDVNAAMTGLHAIIRCSFNLTCSSTHSCFACSIRASHPESYSYRMKEKIKEVVIEDASNAKASVQDAARSGTFLYPFKVISSGEYLPV